MALPLEKRWPYRMKDLCEKAGVSRQAIHFYIQQGLLPEGRKTGRNMAWYGDEHLERLSLIRKLQSERLLPLKTIKTLLHHQPSQGEPEQREMLLELKSRLSGDLAPVAEEVRTTVAAKELVESRNIELAEIRRMAELELITLAGPEDAPEIPRDSVWMIDLWSQIRAVGLTEKLGFTVDDLVIYEQVVASLFAHELELIKNRLASLPAERVADMVTRALPLIHTFIAHYHTAAVRSFFDAME